jgi:hypothetical protein
LIVSTAFPFPTAPKMKFESRDCINAFAVG